MDVLEGDFTSGGRDFSAGFSAGFSGCPAGFSTGSFCLSAVFASSCLGFSAQGVLLISGT